MGLFIDVHCHLDFEGLVERLDEVIDNAKKVSKEKPVIMKAVQNYSKYIF